jgi:hypothetical protein
MAVVVIILCLILCSAISPPPVASQPGFTVPTPEAVDCLGLALEIRQSCMAGLDLGV